MHSHIRWMVRRDLHEVCQMDQVHNTCPWDADEYVRHLRKHGMVGMVVERSEVLHGVMLYELHKERLDVIHMTYADQDALTAMVDKLLYKLSPTRRTQARFLLGEDYETAADLKRHKLSFMSGPEGITAILDYYDRVFA